MILAALEKEKNIQAIKNGHENKIIGNAGQKIVHTLQIMVGNESTSFLTFPSWKNEEKSKAVKILDK